MRIAISTIAKNEDHNVRDFVKNCQEADLISVLDTGSTDKTVELLKKHKAFAGQAKIEPFRFDEARNKALDLLPQNIDVVISVDLDERLNPGWRKVLEKFWAKDSESASYWYKQYQGQALITEAWRSKIFRRKGYRWFNPVHEIPLPKDQHQPKIMQCPEIIVEHFQTGQRNYEPLLTEVIKKEPQNANAYLERAAEWNKKAEPKKAIADFETYLDLTRNEHQGCPGCDFCELIAGRRAFACLDIAKELHNLKSEPAVILKILLQAAAECPNLREAWVYLADSWLAVGNYPAAYGAAMTALKITDSGIHTRSPVCWSDFPRQLAANAYAKILNPKP